jgi:hypothetical protein
LGKTSDESASELFKEQVLQNEQVLKNMWSFGICSNVWQENPDIFLIIV